MKDTITYITQFESSDGRTHRAFRITGVFPLAGLFNDLNNYKPGDIFTDENDISMIACRCMRCRDIYLLLEVNNSFVCPMCELGEI